MIESSRYVVIAHLRDGSSGVLFVSPAGFNLQAWVNVKKQYFPVLGIVRIEGVLIR